MNDQHSQDEEIDIFIEWPEQYGMRELAAGENLEKLNATEG